MVKSELLEIIANGENSGVEFKRDDVQPQKVAKELVAMANLKGGRLLLGVEDDGTVSGIQRDNTEEWVMDTIFGHYVHPQILPYYEEVKLDDDKTVAIISIDEGTTKPYVLRNKGKEEIYIRVGTISKIATREQQARLYQSGGMLHAEALPVSGSKFESLDIRRMEDYLERIVRESPLPDDKSKWISILTNLGFMVDTNRGESACTITGAVLFGKSPRRFIRQAGIRWMAFEGTDKSYTALDDQILDGPMVELWENNESGERQKVEDGLIERFLDRITPFISREDIEENGIKRERSWNYPVPAIREAIINALAHRDWTRSEEVEVCSYSDRMEIISAGSLQNSMTVEKMINGQRSARNHLIVNVLRDYGYVEARGMGVRNKIIPMMKQHNNKEPEFEATDDYLKIILWKKDPSQ
jgi:ATP-dependent DNA helicase RecG